MMNNVSLISKRYALAFLNIFSLSREQIDRIKQAISFLDQHDEVFLMLKIPLLAAAKKEEALHDYLINKYALPESFSVLIRVLSAEKRLFIINEVMRWIVQLYQENKEIELFEIASADSLAPEDVRVIEKFLADSTGHSIITQQKIDRDLIAGIRLKSTQHLWEYSIRKQLAAVQRSLKE